MRHLSWIIEMICLNYIQVFPWPSILMFLLYVKPCNSFCCPAWAAYLCIISQWEFLWSVRGERSLHRSVLCVFHVLCAGSRVKSNEIYNIYVYCVRCSHLLNIYWLIIFFSRGDRILSIKKGATIVLTSDVCIQLDNADRLYLWNRKWGADNRGSCNNWTNTAISLYDTEHRLEVRCDAFDNLTITFNHYACPMLGPSDIGTDKVFRLQLLSIFKDCSVFITLFPHVACFVPNKMRSVLEYNSGTFLAVLFDLEGLRRHDLPKGWLAFSGLHVS